MKEKFEQLEFQLGDLSRMTNLSDRELVKLPVAIREIHSYKLFGVDLLAIPTDLEDKIDRTEFERPFRFIGDLEDLMIFESEFRSEIPENFIQIGSLYGATEIVLLEKVRNSIHIFNVSDISDLNWLKYKLDKELCSLEIFIENLRLQTVCCLMNPKDYSQWDIFEIKDATQYLQRTDY